MKKLLIISLISCLVLSMSMPVSADYYWYKDVNATDMVDELITYVKYNCSIDDWGWQLSKHKVYEWNETKKKHAFDLMFTCKDRFYRFVPMPIPLVTPEPYEFMGEMHVKDKRKMTQKYTLTITDEDKKFRATGENWWLEVWNTWETRFKA